MPARLRLSPWGDARPPCTSRSAPAQLCFTVSTTRPARLAGWTLGAWIVVAACQGPAATKPTTYPAATEANRSESEALAAADAALAAKPGDRLAELDAIGARPELLVAKLSPECSAKQCDGPCCKLCGREVWTVNSDPRVQVDARAVALPNPVETECGLHYDLSAEGSRKGDRFVVRRVQPVPSPDRRRAGRPGQLTLLAEGLCTLVGCFPRDPCCNSCSFVAWSPEPTHDQIAWSGTPLPIPEFSSCGSRPDDVAVTGTWLGPSAFEVKSFRWLPRASRR